jgi:flagellar biogenesis protein FliO
METTLKSSPAGFIAECWTRLRRLLPALRMQRSERQLRLCESVSLGEKRIVAVVEYEGQRFLLGGSAQSVHLLARLGSAPDFSELLSEWCERQR